MMDARGQLCGVLEVASADSIPGRLDESGGGHLGPTPWMVSVTVAVVVCVDAHLPVGAGGAIVGMFEAWVVLISGVASGWCVGWCVPTVLAWLWFAWRAET